MLNKLGQLRVSWLGPQMAMLAPANDEGGGAPKAMIDKLNKLGGFRVVVNIHFGKRNTTRLQIEAGAFRVITICGAI
jgi:hypothetical protein